MEKRKKEKHQKAASAPDEPPYEGEAGRTRLEHVHVTIPGGFVRSVRVYKAVNVGTDPELRDAALSGALHRFEGGEELAIPFVFHDPDARRFALVVPDSLRHRELPERVRLLQSLAEDTAHAISPYVREAHVVIGVNELAQYLAEVGTAARTEALKEQLREQEEQLRKLGEQLEQREGDLTGRDQQLSKREQRLKARAEEVTRREDDLRSAGEEGEAQHRDLAMREEELAHRLAALKQREEELGRRLAAAASQPPPTIPSSVPPAPPPAEDIQEVDDVEELEEIDELQAVDTNARAVLTGAVRVVEERSEVAALDNEVEDIVDDDDVEELDDDDVREVTGVTAVGDPTTPGGTDAVLESRRTEIASGVIAGVPVAPPAGFLEDREREMAATLADGVWLFAKLEEGQEQGFRGGADLLAQLVVVQGYPVVVLALVESAEGRPLVCRMALDPGDAEHRAVLESLRQRFEATVAIFGPAGNFERTVELAAPRRVNVAMLLERVTRMMAAAKTDGPTAVERALAAPPPVSEASHPFQSEDLPPSENALEASKRLARLFEWSTPEKLDRALLALSVPRDVVDGSMRSILEDTVRFGLALPGPLVSRAVSVGVAPEPGELVTRQIAAFRETIDLPDRSGLTLEDIADNWEQLLAAAGDSEITVDTETHDLAWSAIRKVRGDSTGSAALADIDPSKLPDMGKPELVMLLDHPKVRRDAALELLRRSDPELLETLYKAVRKMPRSEVVRVVPRIIEFGESAGDALIDGLNARKTFVRQASAIALGHLKLRRAVVPLVHLLTNEPSEIWREIARVLGEFGTAAFRAISRALKDPKGFEERFILTLAHLANHGCEAKVERLTKDEDRSVAVMALQALNLQKAAQQTRAMVRGESPLAEDDGVLAFSRRFYEELLGTAPEADLADPDEAGRSS